MPKVRENIDLAGEVFASLRRTDRECSGVTIYLVPTRMTPCFSPQNMSLESVKQNKLVYWLFVFKVGQEVAI